MIVFNHREDTTWTYSKVQQYVRIGTEVCNSLPLWTVGNPLISSKKEKGKSIVESRLVTNL